APSTNGVFGCAPQSTNGWIGVRSPLVLASRGGLAGSTGRQQTAETVAATVNKRVYRCSRNTTRPSPNGCIGSSTPLPDGTFSGAAVSTDGGLGVPGYTTDRQPIGKSSRRTNSSFPTAGGVRGFGKRTFPRAMIQRSSVKKVR